MSEQRRESPIVHIRFVPGMETRLGCVDCGRTARWAVIYRDEPEMKYSYCTDCFWDVHPGVDLPGVGNPLWRCVEDGEMTIQHQNSEPQQHECKCLGQLAEEILELIKSVGELRMRIDAVYRKLEQHLDAHADCTVTQPPHVITISDSFYSGDYDA